jgi:hypothetical protein
MKKAIVTLAIGEKYIKLFDQFCRKNWTNYCKKYDFDLIVIKKYLDGSDRAIKRSPAWQKLLICSQDWSIKYDHLVWIDADILINYENADDICKNIPINKISAVEAWSIPNRRVHDISLKRLYNYWDKVGIEYINNFEPDLYYKKRGIFTGNGIEAVMQTGVFACSPTYHKDLFEHIYYSYEDTHGAEWNYEMPAMSYEIIKNNLQNWIIPEFNYCVTDIASAYYPFIFQNDKFDVLETVSKLIGRRDLYLKSNKIAALKNIFELGYFIHFAGCSSWMRLLHNNINIK